MRKTIIGSLIAIAFFSGCGDDNSITSNSQFDVGVRPMYLVDSMKDSALKKELESCQASSTKKSDFSIGHRGAAMQFPEHTKESYIAAARMGAGIIECDVTFTKDEELVCRHSQCDLHTTTNILETALANKCSVQPDMTQAKPFENVKCCTSDITLAEFKSLKGKMDAGNANAKTVEEYMASTPDWRTDLYTETGTLMTHAESIELFTQLNVKMTPELKSPSVAMPYNATFTQENYASKMIQEYIDAGVNAKNVFAQSFNYTDVLHWVNQHPDFGEQAVYLDGRAYGETADDRENFDGFNSDDALTWGNRSMDDIKASGVNYVAPPMWVLVKLSSENEIIPSAYSTEAKASGLKMITWTLERSGLLNSGGGWYYQTTNNAIKRDGDAYELLDVLAQDVGITGIFSDWPATVTYYANCKGL
ncbi:MAG: glycerophosphodiester phosphodiesterase family protein [Campylobacterota bacterium]|nr:glycerophosphodiester phosphodiesterase family protein [Campylobacterota bacterium]